MDNNLMFNYDISEYKKHSIHHLNITLSIHTNSPVLRIPTSNHYFNAIKSVKISCLSIHQK